MNKIAATVAGVAFVLGVAFAGSMDPPGPPSSGSGLCTLQQLYDYLTSGAAVTIPGAFQEPGAGPSDVMCTTKQIYEAVATPFAQCNATVADVKSGVKFFSTVSGNWGVKTGSMSGGISLLKTGQTSVYLAGDDGTYRKGGDFNYSWDVGASTVRDNVTGLIWASSGAHAGCYYGSTLIWGGAIDWAENLSFAGYTDWRLPNYRELESLVHQDAAQGAPYINKTFFPNTLTTYWTSTSAPYGTPTAFAIDFNNGYAMHYTKDGSRVYVRAVRGGGGG